MFLSTRDGFLNHCPVKPFVINLDFFVFILFYFFLWSFKANCDISIVSIDILVFLYVLQHGW